MPPRNGRKPSFLMAFGLTFVVLGALQTALTDMDAGRLGLMTGGALVFLVGVTLEVLRRRPKT
jgi:hypothetical protein